MQVVSSRVMEVVASIHDELETLHEGYDRAKAESLARYIIDAVDKEGFIIPFDEVWQLAGYEQKGHAKRILKGERGKLKLRENIDYIRLESITEKYTFPSGIASSKGPHGGHNREDFMLTTRCFMQFALAAQTTQGVMLRDFVFQMLGGIKRLGQAIARGEVELKRARPAESDTAGEKRIKACDTNKSLMSLMQETGASGDEYAKVNGETNKAATGRYKYETARMLGKKPSAVNARDYMTEAQLIMSSLVEVKTRDVMIERGLPPLEAQKFVIDSLGTATSLTQGPIADAPLTLKAARAANQTHALPASAPSRALPVPVAQPLELPAPAPAPAQTTINVRATIKNYFQVTKPDAN